MHEKCRKKHSNTRRYEQVFKRKHDVKCASAQVLRSDVKTFSFHTDCYLCGKYVDREKAKYEFSHVMFLHVKQTVAERCTKHCENQADEWADAVSQRLACINDLLAEEAIYHRRYFQYFMSPRNLHLDALSPSKDGAPPPPLPKRGRPSRAIDEEKKSVFMQVIEYLECNHDETITLDELHEIMVNQASSGEVYSKKSLQRQLYAHYGDRVSITSSKQQPIIVNTDLECKALGLGGAY